MQTGNWKLKFVFRENLPRVLNTRDQGWRDIGFLRVSGELWKSGGECRESNRELNSWHEARVGMDGPPHIYRSSYLGSMSRKAGNGTSILCPLFVLWCTPALKTNLGKLLQFIKNLQLQTAKNIRLGFSLVSWRVLILQVVVKTMHEPICESKFLMVEDLLFLGGYFYKGVVSGARWLASMGFEIVALDSGSHTEPAVKVIGELRVEHTDDVGETVFQLVFFVEFLWILPVSVLSSVIVWIQLFLEHRTSPSHFYQKVH